MYNNNTTQHNTTLEYILTRPTLTAGANAEADAKRSADTAAVNCILILIDLMSYQ